MPKKGVNQKLSHDELAEIPALGEKPPNHGRAELHKCYGAHDECGDHRRMALIAHKREDVKIQSGHPDVGDAEGDDDNPEGWSAERLATTPSDIVGCGPSRSRWTFFFCRRSGVMLKGGSPVRQEPQVFGAPAHKEQGRAHNQPQCNEAEDGPSSAPSCV